MWAFGAKDMDVFEAESASFCLEGQMEKIRVTFLVTHGEKDRQIRLDYAHAAYDQMANAPRRKLKIFTGREGGVEHVGAVNMTYGRNFIADWFAATLGGLTAPAGVAAAFPGCLALSAAILQHGVQAARSRA